MIYQDDISFSNGSIITIYLELKFDHYDNLGYGIQINAVQSFWSNRQTWRYPEKNSQDTSFSRHTNQQSQAQSQKAFSLLNRRVSSSSRRTYYIQTKSKSRLHRHWNWTQAMTQTDWVFLPCNWLALISAFMGILIYCVIVYYYLFFVSPFVSLCPSCQVTRYVWRSS